MVAERVGKMLLCYDLYVKLAKVTSYCLFIVAHSGIILSVLIFLLNSQSVYCPVK